MKKLLTGLFIFGTFFVGFQQVHASTLSDALLKIQNLTKEIAQLQSRLKASVADPNLPSISNITTNPSWASLELKFNVSSPLGITEVGYCLKKTNDSIPCSRNIIRGLSSYSDVRINIASIEPTTNYTYYLYAKNSYGEDVSSDINFTSLVIPFEAYVTIPVAYFSPVVNIYPAQTGLTSNTASVGGYLTSLGSTGGISERGACYGSSSSSMLNCMTAYLVQGPNDMFATKFVGLIPDTKYYYRVYAKNSTETVYSSVDSFTTLSGPSDLNPINGAWSSWTNSGSCVNNLQTQIRTCTNPAPLNGGITCSGTSTQQISCSSPVNGGWTSWSNSGGCLNNLQIQTRTCTNPSPASGGTICSGVLAQQVGCSTLTTLPNLTASKVDNDSSYVLNSAVTFNGTITNNGNLSTSGTFSSHFELKSSLNSSNSIINMSPISSGVISAGGSTKVSSSVNLTTAATYSIRLCADQTSSLNTTGTITESNEIDNCGDWTSFVVGSADVLTPSITITSPSNGGESVEVGKKIEIRWVSSNISSALNEIYISDGVHKGHTESVRMENNEGSVIYTLDSNLIPGSNYKAYVSIDSRSAISASDSSDSPFTIKSVNNDSGSSLITVISPNNGFESIENGQKVEIRWTTTNIVGAMINVYVTDGVHSGDVIKTANTGSLIYTLGGSLIPGSNYKAYVFTDGTSPIGDSSDKTFTIKPVSGLCPVNVSYVSCPEYQTEIVKDSNGCVVEFRCSTTLKNVNIPTINTNISSNIVINRVLKRGTRGGDVKKLQQFLGVGADGIFGGGTAASVKAWQIKNGLTPDGLFGYHSRTMAGL